MKRIAIIGLGMIGGSLAKALKHRRQIYITAIDNNSDSIDCALAEGVIDSSCESIQQLPANLDALILATPVSEFASLAEQCCTINPEVTISDVGSTKKNLVEAFTRSYGSYPAQLVPAHPIAGLEKSGFAAANGDLFVDKLVILATDKSDSHHYAKIEKMWCDVGSVAVHLSIDYHDRVLAKTSHLPHLLSFALVHYLASESENYDIFRFAASGFRDFSRIASSDPDMWSSIFAANSNELIGVIEGLQKTIATFRDAIEQGDRNAITDLVTEAKKARDHYVNTLQ